MREKNLIKKREKEDFTVIMAKSAQINSMPYRKFLKNFFLKHAIKIDFFCHYYSERVEIIAKLFHRPLSPKAHTG